MLKVNKKALKNNMLFIVGSILIIILAVVLNMVFSKTTNEELIPSDLSETGEENIYKLVINELMSSNGGALSDDEGNICDWVELYNGTEHDINIKNYGLSDRENDVKWVFPNVTIKAKSYLIIYLCGNKKEGLYANFKLSSAGGEVLALKNTNGKVIDAVDTVSLAKNQVMGRNLEGKWEVYSKPTPGYANTNDGYEKYIKTLTIDEKEEKKIVINEFLPRNKGNFIDDNNSFNGFIEVKNISSETISLKGYSLSNDIGYPFKWQFPDDVVLSSKEVYSVYTGSIINKDLHSTGFKLYEKNGSVILSNNKGKIIDIVEYSNLANGMAIQRSDDGKKSFVSNNISFGFNNDSSGIKKFLKKYNENPKELMINEVMNSNYKYLKQNGGNYYDWIEFKNNTNDTINLKDYSITTNSGNTDLYKLPDVTLKAGEYYILIASGDTALSNNTYKHANFKISDVEGLYLYKNNKIIDSVLIANIPTGYSYGRNDNYGFIYMSSPTPKKDNSGGKESISYAPIFSTSPGVYEDKVNLSLLANGTIYYTLDGSTPTTSSKKYNGPISISTTKVIKAISYEDNKLKSEIVTGSYMINEKHKLPVLSLSMKPSDFSWVHSNPWKTTYEVPAYAELFEDNSSFSIPCGFELFGGSTRGLSKKSFHIKFKKMYGESELHYQVFNNKDYSIFNSLVIRSGSQDYDRAFFRDILSASIEQDYGTVDVQAYKSVILYINGKYWGIYNIREKVDETFIANHYNVDADKANVYRIDGDVTYGTNKLYREIVNYVTSHDMSKSENYEYIKKKINIENLCDYWAAETYVTNNDIINLRMFNHPEVNDNKLHFIFYDLDWAWYNYQHNYFVFSTNPSGMSSFKVSTVLLRNLMKNKEFKKTYLTRLSYNLKNVWSKENINKNISTIYNYLEPEMDNNLSRWKIKRSEYESRVSFLKSYTKLRQNYILKHAKSYFKLSSSEYEKYFGDL